MPKIFLLLVSTLICSGCATVTRGTTEAFAIETTPPGAEAKLSNGLSCTTPCSLKVKRRGDFTGEINKEGFEPVTASVTSSIDGAGGAGMAGNVLLGGLIGAGVDAGSGAMHSHKPNPLAVTLTRSEAESQSLASATSKSVYDQLEQLGELRDRNVISQTEFETEKAKLLGSATETPDPNTDDIAVGDE